MESIEPYKKTSLLDECVQCCDFYFCLIYVSSVFDTFELALYLWLLKEWRFVLDFSDESR